MNTAVEDLIAASAADKRLSAKLNVIIGLCAALLVVVLLVAGVQLWYLNRAIEKVELLERRVGTSVKQLDQRLQKAESVNELLARVGFSLTDWVDGVDAQLQRLDSQVQENIEIANDNVKVANDNARRLQELSDAFRSHLAVLH